MNNENDNVIEWNLFQTIYRVSQKNASKIVWTISQAIKILDGVEPETYQRKDASPPNKMFIARKIRNKSWWYQISRWIHHFKFLKSIVLFPDIVQKCFYTPDRARDPTFQMRYVSAAAQIHLKMAKIIILPYWRVLGP